MILHVLILVGFPYSYAYEMRPIRVNKSLLPSDLESMHERHWKVFHRKEMDHTRMDEEKDFEIEEVQAY